MVIALSAFSLVAARVLARPGAVAGVDEGMVSRAIVVPVEIIEAGEAPALREILVER